MNFDFSYILACIERLHSSDRYFTSEAIAKTCQSMEDLMREAGLDDVRTLKFQADGKTEYGGWVMPVSWDVKEATLSLVRENGEEEEICRQSDNPCSLMLYSRPVDVITGVVLPEAENVQGKLVLFTEKPSNMMHNFTYFQRGAVGILSSGLGEKCYGKPGYEYLEDVCKWKNYDLPLWQDEHSWFGFSLTPRQGKRLKALLQQGDKVCLHCKVESKIHSDGFIPVVTGVLKGETDEEVLVTGHLFEYGANDNASGPSTVLAILRELSKQKKLKRSIRLMATFEVRSTQALLNQAMPLLDCSKIVAGLNADMVGVASDKVAQTGGSRPFNPDFALPLFNHFVLEKAGYTVRDVPFDFDCMDNTYSDITVGSVPFAYFVMVTGDPNYHKSSDTPDKIDPEIIQDSFETISKYLLFLADGGKIEALQAVELVKNEYHKLISAAADDVKAYKLDEAKQALQSVMRIMRQSSGANEVQEAINKVIVEIEAAFPLAEEQRKTWQLQGKLSQAVPMRNFKAAFSFEDKLKDLEKWPADLLQYAQGWAAPNWIQFMFFFMNGKRTFAEIYNLICASEGEIDQDAFWKMVDFLKERISIVG